MEKKVLHTLCQAFLCILTSLLLSNSGLAQKNINMGNRFQIDKNASYISFKTTMSGFPVVRGSLKAYQATMFYDPEDIMSTSATIRIGSEGFTTSHDKRDAELQSENFLNTAEFPAIWFQGTKVKITNSGFDLSGTMNIKNINKPVTIHMEKPTVMRKSTNNFDEMVVNGNLKINRKDFDLGTTGKWASDPTLGDEIEIEFTFLGFSYTIDYLKSRYIKQVDGRDHAVGLVYNDVKANGVKSGLKLVEALRKDKKYESDKWLSNLANIGWILMVDGLGKESLSFYDKALEEDPEHFVSLVRLGDAYAIAGQYDDALAHYKKEGSLPARAKFTHIPHMIKVLSGEFELKNMK